MGVFASTYTLWHAYGSDIQNGAVVLSAIAAFRVISDARKTARRRGTLDLILHQQSDRELVLNRTAFNKIKVGEIRPSTYGKPDKRGTPQAETMREVLNIHELTSVAIEEGVIDESVYRRWFNATFISDYDTTKDYIAEMRKTYNNPNAFAEFEKVATRWKEDRDWPAAPGWGARKVKALRSVWKA